MDIDRNGRPAGTNFDSGLKQHFDHRIPDNPRTYMPRDAGRGTGLIPKGSILGRDVQLANSKNLVNTWPQTKVFEAALDVLDRINDGRITKEELSRELKDEKHLESNKEKLDEITAQLKARGAQVNGSDDLVEYFQILLNVGVDEKHKDFAQFNADKSKRSAAEKARDLYERGAPLTRLLKSLLMVVGEDIIKPIDSGYRPRLDIPPSTPSSWSQYRSFSPSDHTPTPLLHSDVKLKQQLSSLQEQVEIEQDANRHLHRDLDETKEELRKALEEKARIPDLVKELETAQGKAAQVDGLKAQVSDLEREVARLGGEARSEKSAKEALQSELADVRKELENAEAEAARLKGLEAELALAKAEAEKVEGLEEKVGKLEGEVQWLERAVDGDKRAKETLQTDLDESKALNETLQSRLQAALADVERLKKQVSLQNQHVTNVEEGFNAAEKTRTGQLESVEAQRKKDGEEIKALKERLQKFEEKELRRPAEIEDLEEKLETAERKNVRMLEQQESMSEELVKARGEVKKVQEDNQALNEYLELMTDQFDQFGEGLKEIEIDFDKSEARVRKLESELEEKDRKISEIDSEKTSVKSELSSLKPRLKQIELEKKQAADELEVQKKETARIKEEMNHELAEVKKKLGREHQSALKDVESERKANLDLYNESETKLGKAQGKVRVLSKKNESLEEEKAELERQVDDLTSELGEAETKFDRVHQQLLSAESYINSIADENRQINELVEDLEKGLTNVAIRYKETHSRLDEASSDIPSPSDDNEFLIDEAALEKYVYDDDIRSSEGSKSLPAPFMILKALPEVVEQLLSDKEQLLLEKESRIKGLEKSFGKTEKKELDALSKKFGDLEYLSENTSDLQNYYRERMNEAELHRLTSDKDLEAERQLHRKQVDHFQKVLDGKGLITGDKVYEGIIEQLENEVAELRERVKDMEKGKSKSEDVMEKLKNRIEELEQVLAEKGD